MSPCNRQRVLAAVDSTGAPVEVTEVLKGPHPLIQGLTVEQRFTSGAKAERAGLEHWPEATIDVDVMVKAFEVRERARIPAKVAAERERLELVQRTRQLAARKGITLDEAREQMARHAEKLAASRGDDDNVLADVTDAK